MEDDMLHLCEFKGGQRSGLVPESVANPFIPPNEILIPQGKKLEGIKMIGYGRTFNTPPWGMLSIVEADISTVAFCLGRSGTLRDVGNLQPG